MLITSLQKDIHTIEKRIISKEKRLFRKNESHPFHRLLVILFLVGSSYFFYRSVRIESFLPITYWIVAWTLFTALYIFLSLTEVRVIESETRLRISELLEKHRILSGTFQIIEDPKKILSNIEMMYALITENLGFIKGKNIRGFDQLISKEILFCNMILTDLRSDLATRLTEQRSILESAKTEVENTITGTPELIAVSEAQQVRLNRQIEQFEELQRVLVRV